MSTHFVQLPAVARLQNWGLLDRLWEAGTPQIQKVTIYLDGNAFNPPRPVEDAPWPCAPRRYVLDDILVRAAVDAGAELRENFSVRELVFEDDAVAGVRGSTKGGALVEERARLVIGADGLHSFVARQVKPVEYDRVESLTFAYYSYFSGVDVEGTVLAITEDGGILMFPTNDDMYCIATGGPAEEFHKFREDIEGNFYKSVDRVPVGPQIRAGKREERFMGTNDQPNYFRKPYGPGWALVGDAGYHRDFITGHGINDAIRDAELVAEAADAWLSGRRAFEDAMGEYEATRNRLVKPVYDVTLKMARGDADPGTFLQLGPAIIAQMPAKV
jgi:flavin-dependent dehydrogenase